jgi:hypothetical protein
VARAESWFELPVIGRFLAQDNEHAASSR